MWRELVVVGIGELGSLYATAALKLGLRVSPQTRTVAARWDIIDEDAPVLIATGEEALQGAIASLPRERHHNLILLQNELFPSTWTEAGARDPSVIIPWLSKKKGSPVEIARPSLVFGRHATLLTGIHAALGIPSTEARNEAELHEGLVAKFAFILTINALGLVENLTLGEWLVRDAARVAALVSDATALGEALVGHAVDRANVRAHVEEAMQGLSSYPSRGRTAEARMRRAADLLTRHSVDAPALRAVCARVAGSGTA